MIHTWVLLVAQRSLEPHTATYRQHKVIRPWLGANLQCISQHTTKSALQPTMPARHELIHQWKGLHEYYNMETQKCFFFHKVKGTDPFWGHDFLPTLVIISYLFFFFFFFFFFGWKSILRYLRNVSQNIRGLRVPEPPQMGANIYIYIYI